eukprot:COSAG06_NODE_3568_length_5176_cov_22.718732_7_plen_34_part_00
MIGQIDLWAASMRKVLSEPALQLPLAKSRGNAE